MHQDDKNLVTCPAVPGRLRVPFASCPGRANRLTDCQKEITNAASPAEAGRLFASAASCPSYTCSLAVSGWATVILPSPAAAFPAPASSRPGRKCSPLKMARTSG